MRAMIFKIPAAASGMLRSIGWTSDEALISRLALTRTRGISLW